MKEGINENLGVSEYNEKPKLSGVESHAQEKKYLILIVAK